MKKILFIFLSLFLTIFNIQATISKDTLCNPNPSKEAVALFRYIHDVYGKKILSGQMWVPWGNDGFVYIKDITEKQPAIMGIDFINEGDNSTNVTKALAWAKLGGIVTAMWHQGAPGVGEGYDASKGTAPIDSCFKPGTKEYIAYWAALKKKADWLKKFKDANVPVLWRPYHELNGGWFWWSKEGPEKFKQLWDTMFNYFVYQRGLDNLIWVLCYSGQPDLAWHPGKQYVDIVGGDTYGVGSDVQLNMFNQLKSITGNDTIPIVYHECGVPPDPDQCLLKGAMWSWWMEWHTDYLFGVDTAYLNKVYNHDLVITLDELPDIPALYSWNADSCQPSVIIPKMMVDSDPWQDTNKVPLRLGSTVKFYAQVTDSGTLSWNGFGTSGSLPEQTILVNGTGTATAIFTNYCGATNTETFNIVDTCTPTFIKAYCQIEGGTLKISKNIFLYAGTSITLSPQAGTGGSWSWSGCGTSGTSREQTIAPDSTCSATVNYVNECGKASSLVYKITVAPPSFISSYNNDQGFSVYPDPCKDLLNIELPQVNTNELSVIYIYTLQGTLVLKEVTNLKSIKLNTSGLKPNIYILSIVNNDIKVSKRFLKIE